MRLVITVDGRPLVSAVADSPQSSVVIEQVDPSVSMMFDRWLDEEEFVTFHSELDGGYEGYTDGLDDFRAFEQRVLRLVVSLGTGWDYRVEA